MFAKFPAIALLSCAAVVFTPTTARAEVIENINIPAATNGTGLPPGVTINNLGAPPAGAIAVAIHWQDSSKEVLLWIEVTIPNSTSAFVKGLKGTADGQSQDSKINANGGTDIENCNDCDININGSTIDCKNVDNSELVVNPTNGGSIHGTGTSNDNNDVDLNTVGTMSNFNGSGNTVHN